MMNSLELTRSCDTCSGNKMRALSIFDMASHRKVARWAPIALRLVVGYGFMEHGWAKLARGPESFAHILQALGMPLPDVLAWATILVELIGGAAMLLGAFVPLVSIPMAAVLLAAIGTVHLQNGFSSIKLLDVTAAGAQFGPPGYETDLLYLACIAALVVGGPGPWAVDRLIAKAMPASTCEAGTERHMRSEGKRTRFRSY